MGREIKRVPLEFDWPIGDVWPGNMINICDLADEDCDRCKKFASLIGLPVGDYGCPEFKRLSVPEGEGWQIWETVSEGSAITPVFATPEELATWCVENNNGRYNLAGPGARPSYDGWMAFIQGGWAPSMAWRGGKIMSGVIAISESESEGC